VAASPLTAGHSRFRRVGAVPGGGNAPGARD
jgi:hypothetical protein